MVAVLAIQAFDYDGQWVNAGDVVEMDPLQAAIHAHAGHISLNHGDLTYQTREMVPEPVALPVTIDPPKRPRGRPRKHKPS